MSSTIFNRLLKSFIKIHILQNTSDIQRYVLFGGIITHCAYSYGTTKNEIIIIKDKYKFVRNGYTEFMIIDNTGKHYNVNNSLWFWKWNSIEDWSKLEPNAVIVKYYGWRVPILGLFPNIVSSQNYCESTNQ